MAGLKPIGSEKLEGMDKISRIMEIARYKEVKPTPINENKKSVYSKTLADGHKYTGSLMGITNMLGAISGIIGVYISGLILEVTNSWDAIFYVVAGVMFFGMIFYLLFASVEKQFD